MEMAKKLDEEHIIRAVREGILDHVSGYHFLELIFRDFHKNNSSHKLMAVGVISYVLHPKPTSTYYAIFPLFWVLNSLFNSLFNFTRKKYLKIRYYIDRDEHV